MYSFAPMPLSQGHDSSLVAVWNKRHGRAVETLSFTFTHRAKPVCGAEEPECAFVGQISLQLISYSLMQGSEALYFCLFPFTDVWKPANSVLNPPRLWLRQQETTDTQDRSGTFPRATGHRHLSLPSGLPEVTVLNTILSHTIVFHLSSLWHPFLC